MLRAPHRSIIPPNSLILIILKFQLFDTLLMNSLFMLASSSPIVILDVTQKCLISHQLLVGTENSFGQQFLSTVIDLFRQISVSIALISATIQRIKQKVCRCCFHSTHLAKCDRVYRPSRRVNIHTFWVGTHSSECCDALSLSLWACPELQELPISSGPGHPALTNHHTDPGHLMRLNTALKH